MGLGSIDWWVAVGRGSGAELRGLPADKLLLEVTVEAIRGEFPRGL